MPCGAHERDPRRRPDTAARHPPDPFQGRGRDYPQTVGQDRLMQMRGGIRPAAGALPERKAETRLHRRQQAATRTTHRVAGAVQQNTPVWLPTSAATRPRSRRTPASPEAICCGLSVALPRRNRRHCRNRRPKVFGWSYQRPRRPEATMQMTDRHCTYRARRGRDAVRASSHSTFAGEGGRASLRAVRA